MLCVASRTSDGETSRACVRAAAASSAKAARSGQLQRLFQQHLQETETQVERLNACFGLLGETARAKQCKGMMGLVEEGEEVMRENVIQIT